MENKMDLSFSGAGFMGCYYFGVVDCWNKYIPKDRVNRVAGASAGSLIAAYYLMDLPMGTCLKEIIALTEDIRRRPLGVFDRNHQIVDILPRMLDKLFPDDAHKRVSNRLHVCMTRLKDMKKIIVNEFETKKDLIDALNCSCFIPVWSGNHVSTYKGVKHIDGGFSDNLPVFDEHTIRICCFSGASDISPYDRAKMELLSGTVLNMPLYWNFANFRRFRKALFPPPASYIIDLLERGFHDTKDFILSNDLIQCDSCYTKTSPEEQTIFQRPSPTLTPCASPAISRVGSFRILNGGEGAATATAKTTLLDENNNPIINNINNKSKMTQIDENKIKTSFNRKKKDKSFEVLVSEKLLRSCSPVESNCSSAGYFSASSGAQSNNNLAAATPIIVINEAGSNEVEESPVSPSSSLPDSNENENDDNDSDRSSSAESDGSDGMQTTKAASAICLNKAAKAADSGTNKSSSIGGSCVVLSRNAINRKVAVPKVQQVPSSAGARRRSSLHHHQSTAANSTTSVQGAGAGAAGESLLVMKDRFTLAPSPLPSCPPSPNLNRHCTECIRLRQEARLDAVEKDIRRVAEQFLGPEQQAFKVGGFKDKLASPLRWLKTLGTKSSYKFDNNYSDFVTKLPAAAAATRTTDDIRI